MSSRSTFVIAGSGLALTILLAAAAQMSLRHAAMVAGIAAGGAAVAGLIGTILMATFRNRSFGAQATVAALTPVLAVAAGAVLAAQAMYVYPHDLPTLGVVIVASLTVALLVCVLLARRVSEATRSLEEAARRIGSGDLSTRVAEPSTREFAALARELDAMSRRLDEARGRERQLDASRRELVAWVSHDLRTPLAGIRAMAEALEDGIAEDQETVERYHRSLRVEADRLSHLVDELFELSVIHAGALNLRNERVPLDDLVADAIAGAAPAAKAAGVRLDGDLSGAGPELELSPPEFTRVLRNLLENAIRHTPRDGAVWVQAGAEDGAAYVAVSDGCGGIPDEDLERVFDLAFRGERARTPGNGSGAGLGLAIARGLIEAQGGTVSVQNHGGGCRFMVRLPLPSAAPHRVGDSNGDGPAATRPAVPAAQVSNGSGSNGSGSNGAGGNGPLESGLKERVRSGFEPGG